MLQDNYFDNPSKLIVVICVRFGRFGDSLSSRSSVFPVPQAEYTWPRRILCDSDERTLAECAAYTIEFDYCDYRPATVICGTFQMALMELTF